MRRAGNAWPTVSSTRRPPVALEVVAIVLFQSGKSAGLSGAIGGVADTFLAKNKAKDVDAKLARMTKWIAIAFVVLTLLLNILA